MEMLSWTARGGIVQNDWRAITDAFPGKKGIRGYFGLERKEWLSKRRLP